MFRRKSIFAFLAAAVFLVPAARAFAEGAEKPAPPQFTATGELLNVRGQFLEIYIEGTKVGYTKLTIGEPTLISSQTWLIEEQTELTAGEGENKATVSITSRAIIARHTQQIICAEATEKHDGWERYGFVSLEANDRGRVLKYYKKVGENVEAWEEPVTGTGALFAAFTRYVAFAMMILPDMKQGASLELRYVAPADGSLKSERIKYVGKTVVDVDGKNMQAMSLQSDGYSKLILDPQGNIVEAVSADGTTVIKRSDEQNYNKTPGHIDGYKLPPFINGNTATFEKLGISVERPDKTCFFKMESDAPIFSVEDGFGEGSLMGGAFDLLPEKATAADLAERFTKILEERNYAQDIRLGAPEESEINGVKGITGTLAVMRHAETMPGRYRAVIKDGRGIVIFFSAPETLWKKNAEWRLGKIAATIKILEKPKDEKPPELVRNVPELGVELTLPNKCWEFLPGNDGLMDAKFAWDGISLTVNCPARQPEMTPDTLQQKIKDSLAKPNMEIKDLKPMKVSGLDAVLAEVSVKSEDGKGPTSKTRLVYVFRQNTFVVLTFTGMATFWDDAVPDMDKIIETMKVTEPAPPAGGETPPENTEQPPAPAPTPAPSPEPAPQPQPAPAPDSGNPPEQGGSANP